MKVLGKRRRGWKRRKQGRKRGSEVCKGGRGETKGNGKTETARSRWRKERRNDERKTQKPSEVDLNFSIFEPNSLKSILAQS